MLRFTDPNSKKVSNGHTTYALLEAARRGHTKIMMVMISPWQYYILVEQIIDFLINS